MGLARILRPDFKSFNDGVQWVKKYKDLFDQNDSMRERIKKNCPQLLRKFDNWTISIDSNIDGGYMTIASTSKFIADEEKDDAKVQLSKISHS